SRRERRRSARRRSGCRSEDGRAKVRCDPIDGRWLRTRSQPGLSLDQYRQGRYSRSGTRTFRTVPRKGNSRRDSDRLRLRIPGIEGGLIGGRTLLAPVQPAEGFLDRRSELLPRERMTGEAIPGVADGLGFEPTSALASTTL